MCTQHTTTVIQTTFLLYRDHDRTHSKKSKQSRVSALWVASTTEPELANSNGKQIDFAEDTDHKPLTVKNGNE